MNTPDNQTNIITKPKRGKGIAKPSPVQKQNDSVAPSTLRGNETVEELESIIVEKKKAALAKMNGILAKKGFTIHIPNYGLQKDGTGSVGTLFLKGINRTYTVNLGFMAAGPGHPDYKKYITELASGKIDLPTYVNIQKDTQNLRHEDLFPGKKSSSSEEVITFLENGGLEEALNIL